MVYTEEGGEVQFMGRDKDIADLAIAVSVQDVLSTTPLNQNVRFSKHGREIVNLALALLVDTLTKEIQENDRAKRLGQNLERAAVTESPTATPLGAVDPTALRVRHGAESVVREAPVSDAGSGEEEEDDREEGMGS